MEKISPTFEALVPRQKSEKDVRVWWWFCNIVGIVMYRRLKSRAYRGDNVAQRRPRHHRRGPRAQGCKREATPNGVQRCMTTRTLGHLLDRSGHREIDATQQNRTATAASDTAGHRREDAAASRQRSVRQIQLQSRRCCFQIFKNQPLILFIQLVYLFILCSELYIDL